jgi:hypothetical protein
VDIDTVPSHKFRHRKKKGAEEPRVAEERAA